MHNFNRYNNFKWIAVAAMIWNVAMPVLSRPVLLELFTSSNSSNCRSAEQAAAKLRQEFSPEELHLLIYQMNNKDPDWTDEGGIRALQCGVKTARLPVAIFNGASRIEGSIPDLYPTYREQIVQKKLGETLGEIQCWIQLSAGSFVAAAAIELPITTPAHELDLYFAITENRSPEQPGVLLAFNYVDAISELTGQFTIQLDRSFTINEVKTEAVWWIEDTISKEIVASSRAVNASPIQRDFNGDGEWDGLDIFWLPFLWGPNSNIADINKDGQVNQSDLLLFLKP